MKIVGFIFNIILWFACYASSKTASVHGLQDFKLHTRLHIARVQQLGLELIKTYPNEFSGVSEKTVSEFLSLHDQSKLKAKTTRELFEFFGKSEEAMTSAEKLKFNNLRNAINSHDNELSMRYLKKFGFLNARGKINDVGRKLLDIQKITDVVDRGLDPTSAEELGKKIVRASQSEYLKSTTLKRMATTLEKSYPQVVKGLGFNEYKLTFIKFVTRSLPMVTRFASGAARLLSAPAIGSISDILNPTESIAGDEEEFEIFYKKHPEFTPHNSPELKKSTR